MRPVLLATVAGSKFTPWFLIPVALVACGLLYSARRDGCDLAQWEGGCARVKAAAALLVFVLLSLILPAVAVLALAVPALGVLLGIYLQRQVDRRSR